jgi:hypothetical protein
MYNEDFKIFSTPQCCLGVYVPNNPIQDILWNEIDDKLKKIPNLKDFKRKLKEYILNI